MSDDRDPCEVAWAAGLFEGEGCFSVYVRASGKIQIGAIIAMTDQDVIERFARVMGFGRLSRRHSQSQVARGDKPLYQWNAGPAENVRETIRLFLPYLGERRRAKALEVLERGADVQPAHAVKTHCPKGHPLAGDNLIEEPIVRKGRDYVARRCRTCRQEQSRERARKRLGITPDRYRVKKGQEEE